MSVHASSGASAPWQILAELRAARAGSADPGGGTDGSAASASGPSQSGSASGVAGGSPPQPPAGLLQFLQQFQSGFTTDSPATDPTTTVPTTTDSTGTTTTGTRGATDSRSAGSDIAKILADLQSLFTQLQQGLSGPPQTNAGTTAAATGSTAQTGTVQTGNDLALQYLNGFQDNPFANNSGGSLLQLAA
jgi:hypothetical protein